MTDVNHVVTENNKLIPPGYRYENDYWRYYQDNGLADQFVLLGQYEEYDLYAIKQHDAWSLGARYGADGDYQSARFLDVMQKIQSTEQNGTTYALPFMAKAANGLTTYLRQINDPLFASFLSYSVLSKYLGTCTSKELTGVLVPDLDMIFYYLFEIITNNPTDQIRKIYLDGEKHIFNCALLRSYLAKNNYVIIDDYNDDVFLSILIAPLAQCCSYKYLRERAIRDNHIAVVFVYEPFRVNKSDWSHCLQQCDKAISLEPCEVEGDGINTVTEHKVILEKERSASPMLELPIVIATHISIANRLGQTIALI